MKDQATHISHQLLFLIAFVVILKFEDSQRAKLEVSNRRSVKRGSPEEGFNGELTLQGIKGPGGITDTEDNMRKSKEVITELEWW